MISTIIGKQSQFAIEVRQGSTQDLGYIRIWINGMYLGAEEEIYLSYVQGALQYILASRDKLAQFPFGSRSAQSIIDKVMLDDSNSLNRYIMKGFGESFDDFVIICFYENHNVNFVWQLVDKPYFDYSGYPSSAQRASLDVDTFSEIINRFNGEIKRMRSHST